MFADDFVTCGGKDMPGRDIYLDSTENTVAWEELIDI